MKEVKDKIDGAVHTLRRYCANGQDCKKCRYRDYKVECPFMNETPPCDWDMNSNRRRFINNWSKAQPEADK